MASAGANGYGVPATYRINPGQFDGAMPAEAPLKYRSHIKAPRLRETMAGERAGRL